MIMSDLPDFVNGDYCLAIRRRRIFRLKLIGPRKLTGNAKCALKYWYIIVKYIFYNKYIYIST